MREGKKVKEEGEGRKEGMKVVEGKDGRKVTEGKGKECDGRKGRM